MASGLEGLLDVLKRERSTIDPWIGRRFEWITRLSTVDRGSVGAELYIRAVGHGRYVGRPGRRGFGYDIADGERKVEAKLATRTVQRSHAFRRHEQFRYEWNGLRTSQDWTHVWFVAVDYENVRAFLVPRSVVSQTMTVRGECYWVGSHTTPGPAKWLADHEIMNLSASL